MFSFVQEYRAEQAIAALRRMLPVKVRVRRDGHIVEIASDAVVPGEIIMLAPGDRIAADAELISARDLRVDESALTGESVPASPDREVFAGTYVVTGTAEARVTATGMPPGSVRSLPFRREHGGIAVRSSASSIT